MRALRIPDIENKTGLSEASQRRGQAEGWFPQYIQLGPGSVGLLEPVIDDWLVSRPLVDDPSNKLGVRRAGPGRGHKGVPARKLNVTTDTA
jgi:predicted DNA-binding transcriptional regulator AlpA